MLARDREGPRRRARRFVRSLPRARRLQQQGPVGLDRRSAAGQPAARHEVLPRESVALSGRGLPRRFLGRRQPDTHPTQGLAEAHPEEGEVSKRRRGASLVLTCEHAGNRIPAEYAWLFTRAAAVLASHRGWDPGALPLGKLMASKLRTPLLSTSWSRLLVEANRSAHLKKVWSPFTADLPESERERILARYWRPHRREVEQAVRAGISTHGNVVHVAVHSFTPELDGEQRNADVGFLYDSKRRPEADLARRWGEHLRAAVPGLRVRNNYPYRGDTDGLPTALRKQHGPSRYRGYELEVNQALLASKRWRPVGEALAATLAQALAPKA